MKIYHFIELCNFPQSCNILSPDTWHTDCTYILPYEKLGIMEVIVMSKKTKFLNTISRYFIPGTLGVLMAYGIGSGYMNTASSGTELDEAAYESPAAGIAPVDPYRPELKDVFFNRNSARLREDAKPVLDENAQVLRSEPDMFVVIESYCDSREESPAHLGTERGDAVREYMSTRGVDSKRVLIVNKCSKYDMELVNSTDAVRLDSRVHFVPLDDSLNRDRVAYAR